MGYILFMTILALAGTIVIDIYEHARQKERLEKVLRDVEEIRRNCERNLRMLDGLDGLETVEARRQPSTVESLEDCRGF